MDLVLRRFQNTPKTQRFRHSRCGDKKGFVPSCDLRLPRIEIFVHPATECLPGQYALIWTLEMDRRSAGEFPRT